jgi:hypothetical protein
MDPKLIRIIEDNNLQLHGDIEYFAEMVAQREREACARTIEELLEALRICSGFVEAFGQPEVRAMVREAIAKARAQP